MLPPLLQPLIDGTTVTPRPFSHQHLCRSQRKVQTPVTALGSGRRFGIKPGLLLHRIGQQGQMQPEISAIAMLQVTVEALPQLALINEQVITD